MADKGHICPLFLVGKPEEEEELPTKPQTPILNLGAAECKAQKEHCRDDRIWSVHYWHEGVAV